MGYELGLAEEHQFFPLARGVPGGLRRRHQWRLLQLGWLLGRLHNSSSEGVEQSLGDVLRRQGHRQRTPSRRWLGLAKGRFPCEVEWDVETRHARSAGEATLRFPNEATWGVLSMRCSSGRLCSKGALQRHGHHPNYQRRLESLGCRPPCLLPPDPRSILRGLRRRRGWKLRQDRWILGRLRHRSEQVPGNVMGVVLLDQTTVRGISARQGHRLEEVNFPRRKPRHERVGPRHPG
mmetsp:Transcript_93510/g.204778  ORF Transcript_93510/g.204778 Transcript_93510/m.204778 type:complete len:235 (-) Transcript_93510:3158-3862(-)